MRCSADCASAGTAKGTRWRIAAEVFTRETPPRNHTTLPIRGKCTCKFGCHSMLTHQLIVLVTLSTVCGTSTAQVVPLIGDPQPDAALTIKIGDGTISGKRLTRQ